MRINLNQVLNHLELSGADIEASAVLTIDGLTLASSFPVDIHEDRIGSMFAALQSLGHRAGRELPYGGLEQILVGYERGHALLTRVGHDVLLAALLRSCDEIDHVLELTREGAQRIESVMAAYLAR